MSRARGSTSEPKLDGWSDVPLDLDWMRYSQEGGILGLQEMDGSTFRTLQMGSTGKRKASSGSAKPRREEDEDDGGAGETPTGRVEKPRKGAKRAMQKEVAEEGSASKAPTKRAKRRDAEEPPVGVEEAKPADADPDKAALHREKLQQRRERMRLKKKMAAQALRTEKRVRKEPTPPEPRPPRREATQPESADDGAALPKAERAQKKRSQTALVDERTAVAVAKPARSAEPPSGAEAGADDEDTRAAKKAKADAKRERKALRAAAQASEPDDSGAHSPLAAAADADDLAAPSGDAAAEPCAVDAWLPLGLHSHLLAALSRVGFSHPTPIQAACVPAALSRGKDVVGAAETGSGKTLAFGLPILHFLLTEADDAAGGASEARPPRDAPAALCLLPTRELALQVAEHLSALLPRDPNMRVIALVGGMAIPKQRRMLAQRPAVIVATPGRLWALLSQFSDAFLARLSLVRFLVLDEADRMVAPGHFAELGSILEAVEGAEPLEAEGWRQPGEGAEEEGGDEQGAQEQPAEPEPEPAARGGGRKAAGSAKGSPKPKAHRRQTFLFSATLTLPAELRRKAQGSSAAAARRPKGKAARASKPAKAGRAPAGHAEVEGAAGNPAMLKLLDKLKFHNPIEVVDLTRSQLTVEQLQQRKLACLPEDKEATLWALLRALLPKRGIIFSNSISSVRRLGALLPLLNVPTITLHASMQQRQRLSHLDKFKKTSGSVLLATDVAARGLDIENLDFVIHFHMPYTVETYVHRSGRTARAKADGLCIALVEPADEKRYRTICHGLGPETMGGFKPFSELGSVADVLPRVHRAIHLASKLDSELHSARKKRADSDWLVRCAQEMEIELDDELKQQVREGRSGKGGQEGIVSKREQQRVRDELQRLLQNVSRPTAIQRAAAPHGIALL